MSKTASHVQICQAVSDMHNAISAISRKTPEGTKLQKIRDKWNKKYQEHHEKGRLISIEINKAGTALNDFINKRQKPHDALIEKMRKDAIMGRITLKQLNEIVTNFKP